MRALCGQLQVEDHRNFILLARTFVLEVTPATIKI